MKLAVIDIGSNTTKLKIVVKNNKNQFKTLLYKSHAIALSNKNNNVDLKTIEKLIRTLKKFLKVVNDNKVNDYKCIATQALRIAKNQKQIVSEIKIKAGIDVDIISGERESEYTLLAILTDYHRKRNFAYINGGGGSTELGCHLTSGDKEYYFPFGARTLTDKFLKDEKDIDNAIGKMELYIGAEFNKISHSWIKSISQVYSIGGSIFTAAYIFKKDTKREFDKLNGFKMMQSDLKKVIEILKLTPIKKQEDIPGMDKDRTETVLAGTLVHLVLLQSMKKNSLTICTRSIADGIFYEMSKIIE